MPGLADIEIELLCAIFELINDTSPKTIPSLALVNKCFYSTLKLVVHRRKTIAYVWGLHPGDTAKIKSWLKNDDILRGLRHLTVNWGGVALKDHESLLNLNVKFKDLRRLIETLGHLETLVWNHNVMIPLSILNALHTHQPKAELQIYNFQRNIKEQDENDPEEIALAHSPALTAIKGSFAEYGEFPDLGEACFKRIVANAPNLRFASVSSIPPGCVIHELTANQEDELKKMEQKFLSHKKPNGSLRRLTLDGYRMSESTLKHWAQFVDLSQLESIKVSRGTPILSYFQYAPQVLTSLKHVSLNLSYLGRHNKDAASVIENYLATIAPLRSLSLWSWMGKISLDEILDRHGQTLEVLQLHERETTESSPEGKRKVLTAKNVRAVCEACPNLRDLTLDCDRPNEALVANFDSDEIIKELQQMKLAKLQIYYDLGLSALDGSRISTPEAATESSPIDTTGTTTTPTTTGPMPPSNIKDIQAYVTRLWKFVFGSHPPTSARSLEVKFGEWERRLGGGYPANWVIEEARHRTRWIVKPDERDDRHGEYTVEKYGPVFQSSRPGIGYDD